MKNTSVNFKPGYPQQIQRLFSGATLSVGSFPGPMSQTELKFDSEWNAGDLGCGELVMILREKIMELAPGTILKLTSLDRGAIEDIPAWCAMTGHRLKSQNHPQYFIERKEDRNR